MHRKNLKHVPLAGMALITVWLGAGHGLLRAQAIDCVEEDWELVVSQPAYSDEGPQITTVMAPTGDASSLMVAFNLNYRSQPSYSPGGLEVVAYQGTVPKSTSTQGTARMSTSNETITWTQRLSLSGGWLYYDIDRGESTTWSRFGQGAGILLSVAVPASLSSLDSYSPDESVRKSGVGWQPNRVSRMRLKAVRYYKGGQLLLTDSTPRDVKLVPDP